MIAAKDNDRHFTPEEYFTWEEKQSEKHELIDGRVFAMSGGTQNHSAIAINFLLLIRAHLRGRQCSVFNSDLKVNILNTSNYTYPDLSVTCDDRDRENEMYITYPCLIVEVLSDIAIGRDCEPDRLCAKDCTCTRCHKRAGQRYSTEAYDRGKKFDKYRDNPNLTDYVLVSSEEMAIDIYHKNKVGEWVIRSYREGDRVALDSINLSLPIEQVYEEIAFG